MGGGLFNHPLCSQSGNPSSPEALSSIQKGTERDEDGRQFMSDTKQREIAESVFERNERREAEISDALRQEAARHAAVVENMHRLRTLRLSRQQAETNKSACRSAPRILNLKRKARLANATVGTVALVIGRNRIAVCEDEEVAS
jgi:hypothetical protein